MSYDPDKVHAELERAADVHVHKDYAAAAWAAGERQATRARWAVGLGAAAAVAAAVVIGQSVLEPPQGLGPAETPTLTVPSTTAPTGPTETAPTEPEPVETEPDPTTTDGRQTSASPTSPEAPPAGETYSLSNGVTITLPADWTWAPWGTQVPQQGNTDAFQTCLAPRGSAVTRIDDCPGGVVVYTGVDAAQIGSPLDLVEPDLVGECGFSADTQVSDPTVEQVALGGALAAERMTRTVTCADGSQTFDMIGWRVPDLDLFAFTEKATSGEEDVLAGLARDPQAATLQAHYLEVYESQEGTLFGSVVRWDPASESFGTTGEELLFDVTPDLVCRALDGPQPARATREAPCSEVLPRLGNMTYVRTVSTPDSTLLFIQEAWAEDLTDFTSG